MKNDNFEKLEIFICKTSYYVCNIRARRTRVFVRRLRVFHPETSVPPEEDEEGREKAWPIKS